MNNRKENSQQMLEHYHENGKTKDRYYYQLADLDIQDSYNRQTQKIKGEITKRKKEELQQEIIELELEELAKSVFEEELEALLKDFN